MTHLDEAQVERISRRTVLRGAGVGSVALPLLAACGSSSSSDSPSSSGASSGSASSSGGDAGGGGGGGGTTVPASKVPVGGGTILKAQQVVVTQPAKGDFKAFTAICTHQGCTVGSVQGGQIVCPCHGSHFSIKDGSPVSGPAQAALAAKKVTVTGGQITVS